MGLTLLTLDCSTSTSARAAQCPPCRQPDPDELQRITESIWWYRDEGNHSAEALRLGKQTLCQLSYSRSGGRAEARAARIYHSSPEMGEAGGNSRQSGSDGTT